MFEHNMIPHLYADVPEELVAAVESASGGASFYAMGCPADSSDCSTDSACISDGVCSDIAPCSDTPRPCSDTPLNPPTATGSLTIAKVGSDYIRVRISRIAKATSYEVVWRKTTTTSIEGSIDTTSTVVTIDGLEPETEYVINYRGINDDGIGPFMSSGKHATTLPDRPEDWEWWNPIRSGGDINISANEWNAFCERINEFRDYCGNSQYSFTAVKRGDYISAAIVNQAIRAIQGMSPPTAPPGQASSGTTKVSAAFFNGLKNALNSID